MKKTSLSLVILLFLTIACKDNVDSTPRPTLSGTWLWSETNGGIAGVHNTPASTGKSGLLILKADSTFTTYWADTLTSSGKYRVFKGVLQGSGPDVQTLIQFSNETNPEIYTLKGNSLTIDPGCCDQFVISWTRLTIFPYDTEIKSH